MKNLILIPLLCSFSLYASQKTLIKFSGKPAKNTFLKLKEIEASDEYSKTTFVNRDSDAETTYLSGPNIECSKDNNNKYTCMYEIDSKGRMTSPD